MELIQKYHFYINLEKRIKKKIRCEEELKKIGLKPNRFNAIPHEIGLVGCVKSHIRCIEIAKERNYPFVCIFEDDISFIDTKKIIEYITKYIDHDYDVLYLGAWILDNTYEIINDDLLHIKRATTTHAYIIKNHYYDTILQNYKEGMILKLNNPEIDKYNIDQYNHKLQNIDKWYCFNPILATQKDGYSDNFHGNMKYEKYIKLIPNKDIDLPKISLLTKSHDISKFIPLMVCNIKHFNYPKDKMEWVIVDTKGNQLTEESLLIIRSFLEIDINYIHKNHNNRHDEDELLYENASYDIILIMNEDNIYLSEYIRHSVDILLNTNKEIVGCLDMVFIHPHYDFEISISKDSTSFYETTLCMKKQYWKENKESIKENMIDDDISFETNICNCIIDVCWDKSISDKECHLSKKVCKIQGEKIDVVKNIFEFI